MTTSKIIKLWVKQQNDKEKKLRSFYKKSFRKIINLIKLHLQTEDLLDEENIRYFPERYPFSSEDIVNIFSCLEQFEGVKFKQKRKAEFPTEYASAHGLRFTRIIGQGTALIIERS